MARLWIPSAVGAVLGALMLAGGAAQAQSIVNADFELGNTGFGSDLAHALVNTADGQYTVTDTPSTFNPQFINVPGGTRMLVVNGVQQPGPGTSRVWAQTLSVQPGTCYLIKARASTAQSSNGGPGPRVRLLCDGELTMDGDPVVVLPGEPGQWTDLYVEFFLILGRTSVNVWIESVGEGPNDFYIDDLTIEQTCQVDCNGTDFNQDGDFGTDADIEDFFACLAGNCCVTCVPWGVDINGDGDYGTDADIEAFFRMLAGGGC